MKKSIRRGLLVAALTLSLTVASAVRPQPAHALVGTVAWPFLIVGVALQGSAVLTGIAALHFESEKDSHHRAHRLGMSALAQFFVGVFFLADDHGTLGFQQLDKNQADSFGLTENELEAYNQAVQAGVFEELFQQAGQELGAKPTLEESKQVMGDLMVNLPTDASLALTKVTQKMVSASR